jgi:hypothetical protein
MMLQPPHGFKTKDTFSFDGAAEVLLQSGMATY